MINNFTHLIPHLLCVHTQCFSHAIVKMACYCLLFVNTVGWEFQFTGSAFQNSLSHGRSVFHNTDNAMIDASPIAKLNLFLIFFTIRMNILMTILVHQYGTYPEVLL